MMIGCLVLAPNLAAATELDCLVLDWLSKIRPDDVFILGLKQDDDSVVWDSAIPCRLIIYHT